MKTRLTRVMRIGLWSLSVTALLAGGIRFPIGGAAAVFYSPSDPQNAVLLPGITSQHYAALAGLTAWVVVPLAFVAWSWHRRARKRLASVPKPEK